jgi:hypothetical protein
MLPMDLTAQKVELFLTTTNMVEQLQLSKDVRQFFSEDIAERHVIVKRSILYFYQNHQIVNTFVCKTLLNDRCCYTFDGEKMARVSPAFYIGGDALDMGIEYSVGSSNNNNNNNNNNNGNNNG